MEDIERKQDLSLFLESCAKRFCPECGKPIAINKIGRPRYFCSDRCRWAHNKRAERRREKEREDSKRNCSGSLPRIRLYPDCL